MGLVLAARSDDRGWFARLALERFAGSIPGGPVLVKPNVVSHEPYPTTTHPDMLEAVLEVLSDREVTVADGAAGDLVRPGKALRDHELARACERRGRKLVDCYSMGMSKRRTRSGMELTVSDLMFSHPVIISLPVLKAHRICCMTGAIKNHFGFLSRAQRGKLHFGRADIHLGIASLVRLAPPSLAIVDAVTTLTNTNEVRHGGRPAKIGCLFAGIDPVALDSFGLTLLGKVEPSLAGASPHDVPYIKYAEEMGVGSTEYQVEWVE